ncbi:MAG TPA: V-type ATPase subunit [Spirochaetia bacterium]|nr:V-type ATPase subunit [Spirochaetales bacterium]HRY72740.1 V-type ATPase subunit [Spirochaetia bacterium]
MADRYELAYVYARVCGSLAGSLAGGRAAELLRIGRLADAWRAAFGDAPPALPERSLVAAAESRAVREAQADFVALAASLRGEEPFFVALRRKAEFGRVKRVLLAVREGALHCPESFDPEYPAGFDESAYPSLGSMFSGGRYGWLSDKALEDLPAAENRLDRQFYEELWEALRSVPSRRLGSLRELVALEAELENVVWALRLARYYGMDLPRIESLLVALPGADVVSAALEGARLAGARDGGAGGGAEGRTARRAARRAAKPRGDAPLEDWKYAFLAEGFQAGGIDPRTVEARARRYLYGRLRRALHRHPFTYTPLYCFFKLKEFEAAVVLGLVEGIYLGAPAEEIAWLAPAGGVA